jgi:hypothetical protein
MKQRGIWKIWLGLGVAGTSLGGCTGSDVSVGNEGDAINAGRCYGAATNCRSNLESSDLETGEPKHCDALPEGELTEDFSVDVAAFDGCSNGIDQIALGPDDSVWVQGTEQCDYVSTVWLRHYSADGMLLGRNDEVAVLAEPTQLVWRTITTAPDGQAFLATYELTKDSSNKDEFSELVRVRGFDAQAAPVGEPIVLGNMTIGAISVDGARQITVAGSGPQASHHAVATRLGADGEPLWIHNNLPSRGDVYGVAGLELFPDGNTALLGARSSTSYGLLMLDASGNVSWNRTLPFELEHGYRGHLASDAAGNLTVGLQLPNVGEPPHQGDVAIYSLASSASVNWLWYASATPQIAAHRASGRVVVAGFSGVHVIPQDGQRCDFYTVPPVVIDGVDWQRSLMGIAFAASGTLYVHDGYNVTRFSFPEEG